MADKRTSNRRDGFYWYEGSPYASVTTILKVLDKPALRYWFGREVYRAVVVDPTLDEQNALSAPFKTSGKAKSRGTTVHSLVEHYKQTGKIKTDVPAEYSGYMKAFHDWATEYNAQLLESEKSVVNEKEKYGGTLDLMVYMPSTKKRVVVDVKTTHKTEGAVIYPEYELQVSAYRNADGVQADDGAVLMLKPDGKYMWQYTQDCYDIFLSCKKIWVWQNAEKLEKYGYFK